MDKEELLIKGVMVALSSFKGHVEKAERLLELFARMRGGEEIPEDIVLSEIGAAEQSAQDAKDKLRAIIDGTD